MDAHDNDNDRSKECQFHFQSYKSGLNRFNKTVPPPIPTAHRFVAEIPAISTLKYFYTCTLSKGMCWYFSLHFFVFVRVKITSHRDKTFVGCRAVLFFIMEVGGEIWEKTYTHFCMNNKKMTVRFWNVRWRVNWRNGFSFYYPSIQCSTSSPNFGCD